MKLESFFYLLSAWLMLNPRRATHAFLVLYFLLTLSGVIILNQLQGLLLGQLVHSVVLKKFSCSNISHIFTSLAFVHALNIAAMYGLVLLLYI